MEVLTASQKSIEKNDWMEIAIIFSVFVTMFIFVQALQPLSIWESDDFFQSFKLNYLQPTAVTLQTPTFVG